MKATLERLEGGLVNMEIEVPPEEMVADLNAAFHRVASRVRIPGFRPGKAPAAMVERLVGRAAILEEALDPIIQRVYRDVVREHDLTPVEQAQIEVKEYADGKPLQFVAKVAVAPEVTLGDVQAVRVPVTPEPVTDEDVVHGLEALRRMRAKWVPSLAPAADGDLVHFASSATLADGGRLGNDHTERVLGSGELRPELEEALRGQAPGAEVDLSFTLPADDPNPQLAGQTVQMHLKLEEVKRRELPELDDQLAADLTDGRCATVEELRADLRNRLGEEAGRRAQQAAWTAALDRVVDEASVDVPDVMIARVQDVLVDNLRQQVTAGGTAFSRYLQQLGKTEEEIRQDMRAEAVKSVRTQLVLEALAKREGLVPDAERLQEEIHRRAVRSGMDPEHYRRLANRPQDLEALSAELARQSAREWIRDHALVEAAAGDAEAGKETTAS